MTIDIVTTITFLQRVNNILVCLSANVRVYSIYARIFRIFISIHSSSIHYFDIFPLVERSFTISLKCWSRHLLSLECLLPLSFSLSVCFSFSTSLYTNYFSYFYYLSISGYFVHWSIPFHSILHSILPSSPSLILSHIFRLALLLFHSLTLIDRWLQWLNTTKINHREIKTMQIKKINWPYQ